MMHLLSIIHFPTFGGPHNQALRLSAPLADHGWNTHVLLDSGQGNAAARLRSSGIDTITAPLHRIRATPNPVVHAQTAAGFWRDVNAIRTLIRERAIDLVQVHGLVNPQGAIAARLEHVPLVWQIVDTRTPLVLRRAMMPVLARLAQCVMFDGEALISAHPGAAKLRVPAFVYYPPVDIHTFSPDRVEPNAVKSELGIPIDAPVVGIVANLNPQKGHEYFVRAAAIIHERFPAATFLVVGEEHDTHRAYAERIHTLAIELGIEDRIIYTGGRTDVERLFRAMDLSLITSVPRSEGTTTTAQESMAVQTPVVATDVGAVSEIVEHDVTGFVVPPEDPQAIANAAIRLLRDGELRRQMGHAGRERVMRHFSIERCLEVHLQAYDAAQRRGRRFSSQSRSAA